MFGRRKQELETLIRIAVALEAIERILAAKPKDVANFKVSVSKPIKQ